MSKPESRFIVSVEDRASAPLKKVAGEFNGLGKAASVARSFMAGFGGGLAGALSLAGIAATVRSVADLQDQFGKMAQQTGVSVKALTELDYAAKLSDVSTDELATGLTRLTSKMFDVAQGSKPAKAIFDALGVSVKNADGSLRASDEVLKDIAQRFSEFPDGPEKAAFAVEIFGRSGAKLIPLLNQGRSGLAELAEEARRLGSVFDEHASKAAERFNDNLTRLSKSLDGLKINLFAPLVEALADVTSGFLAARAAGLGFFESLGVADNIVEQIEFYERSLAKLQKELDKGGRDFYGRPVDQTLLQHQIDQTTARLEVLRRLQLTLSGIGEPPGLPKPGKKPRPPDGPKSEGDPLATLIDAAVQRDLERMQALYSQAEEFEGWLAQILADDEHRLEDLANRWKDVIDPTRQYVRELEEVRRLVSRNRLTAQEGLSAEFDIQNRMQDELIGPLDKETREATDAARELGMTFQSAFEDAILGGEKLGDVLRGLGQDISRIFLRKAVTEPLANEASKLFAGLFEPRLSMAPNHATGLDYVPYDGYVARLHRGEKVLTATEARQGRDAPLHLEANFTINGDMSRSQEARLAVMMRNVAIAALADERRRRLT